MKKAVVLCMILALSACKAEQKDYNAQAYCQQMGYAPGTAEYDQCVQDEKMARIMQQQRQEYEQMKRDEEDWKQRRY